MRAETSAVVMAPPAEGRPGVAPPGTWMWMSCFSKTSSLMPKAAGAARTTERAASTDSFMTSPREPVRRMLPLPGWRRISMVSSSPPTSVHASP